MIFFATMNLRTRSELFGLLLTVRKATAPQLIALAAPLGISASNVKSHLSRLVAEGVVGREGEVRRAVYSLTDKQKAVVDGISERLDETQQAPWDGSWLSLAMRMPGVRGEREALRSSLWFDGFRPWGREVWLRPAWPLPWAQTRVDHYIAQCGWCVRGTVVGTVNLDGIRALYAVERLDREALDVASAVSQKIRTFREDGEAFAARHRLTAQIVDVVARDPRLPVEIWHRQSGMTALRSAYRALIAATEKRAAAFVAHVMRDR
jgi:DNA-binding transcriptional regulator PaaX